jgi:hypothetical protein
VAWKRHIVALLTKAGKSQGISICKGVKQFSLCTSGRRRCMTMTLVIATTALRVTKFEVKTMEYPKCLAAALEG